MNVFTDLFSKDLIEAAGFTFLHSLWQIVIIALCLKCLLLWFKKPKLRYVLSLGALALILLCTLCTFYLSYPAESSNISGGTAIVENIISNINHEINSTKTSNNNFNFNYLKAYFPLLFNMWILGFLYLTLKNILGLWFIQKIKRETVAVPDELKDIVDQYQKHLKIRKKIEMLASQMIESPAVVGFFKPVILMPVQMLTGTSYDYLRAIIAHEIAHIYRHDFIVNIIQSVAMSLFYYHPLAWWINNQINEAREQSCDDIAIEICNDALLYSKALLQVSEMQASNLALAQAFYQNKNTLLKRVQRLLKISNQKSNKMEKLIAISLIVGTLVTYTFGFSKQSKITNPNTTNFEMITEKDSLSKSKAINTNEFKMYKYGLVTCTINDKVYELEVKDGIYYYKDEIIPLKPNRLVNLKTENDCIQLTIKNDIIQFTNAEHVRACWSDISPTYKADLEIYETPTSDSISDSKQPKSLDKQNEDNNNMTITPLLKDSSTYNIEVKDGLYYHKGINIPLQPDRTVTIDTEDGPQQLIIKNDSIHFTNAAHIKYDWGKGSFNIEHLYQHADSVNLKSILNKYGFGSKKRINDAKEEKQKTNGRAALKTENDPIIDVAYKRDAIRDSKQLKNPNKLIEDDNNMTITPILKDGSKYEIEVKDGLYYNGYDGINIPLQPDRTITIDTEDGPQQLILENDSMQFANAIGIKYDWGIEYYKVKHVNPDSVKIINDTPEEKQKPNYYPIFSKNDIPIAKVYGLAFKNIVSEQLIKDGLIKEGDAFTFLLTSTETHLNKIKLSDSKHHKYKELFKIVYQTELVDDDIGIEINVK